MYFFITSFVDDIFNNIVACLNVSLYPYDNWKLFEMKAPLLGRHSNKETFLTSLGYPSKLLTHLARRMSCYACQLVLRRSCKNICRLQMCPPVFFFFLYVMFCQSTDGRICIKCLHGNNWTVPNGYYRSLLNSYR